jgi:hypothetical protein
MWVVIWVIIFVGVVHLGLFLIGVVIKNFIHYEKLAKKIGLYDCVLKY